MSNDFTSQNNDKVINVGTNNAPIYTSDKESTEKNQAHINNSGIHNSTVTNHIYQNVKPRDSKQITNHLNWIIFATVIFGMFGIFMLALSKQPSSTTNTQSSSINSIKNVQSDNINSITNIQSSLVPRNENIVVTNTNRAISKPKRIKFSDEKKQIPATSVRTVTPMKSEPSSNSGNNYQTLRCLSYVNGCPPDKEK